MPASKNKPPVLVDFGEWVRRCRTGRGMSQEAFADACELDRSYVGGIERGERNPALINIIRMVQALGMEPSEFFAGLDSQARQALQSERDARMALRPRLARVPRQRKVSAHEL